MTWWSDLWLAWTWCGHATTGSGCTPSVRPNGPRWTRPLRLRTGCGRATTRCPTCLSARFRGTTKMTGDIRPFVFKDEKYRWFARMPKRTPAKARRLVKVALVARGIVEPDAELPVEYVRHEDFGTYLYRTMNKYR